MNMRIFTLAPLAAGLLLAFNAAAQDHSSHHSTPAAPDHSQQQQEPESQPAPAAHQRPASVSSQSTSSETVDHAAMGHSTEEGEVAKRKQTEPVDHAAMGHDAPPLPVNRPRAPDQPVTPIPVLTDADREAAKRPPNDHPVHDNTIQSFVLFNRLEAFDVDEGTGLEWEGQAWFGTDLNKVWLRSEGEREGGHTEAADLEVLYGRPIAPWWDVVAGVRHDFKPGDSQDFAAIGLMGLAPYKFEVQATAYIGESGRTAAVLEAEYETLLTNRLILQPLIELSFHGQDDERRGIGSGLSTAEAGLRLRYEFTRQFAPYIGIVHERSFGRTADLRHEEDEDDTRFVAGVRLWF